MDHTDLQKLIAVGEMSLVTKYFVQATMAVVVWDHLITLSDEVRYAWKGKKTWPFWLFIVCRYSVLLYKIWLAVASYWPGYTQRLCGRTVKLEAYYCVFSITLGHIFLTMRVYALTEAGKYVLAVFGILVASALATGLWFVSAPSATAAQMPKIPLDPFRACVFSGPGIVEWAYRSQVVLSDLLAFLCVVIFVLKLKADLRQSRMTRIMRTILQDGVLFFFVMVGFHVAMMLFTGFGKLSALPPAAITVLVPVMISRLVLSLRKAADTSLIQVWEGDHFTPVNSDGECEMMSFADPPSSPEASSPFPFSSHQGSKQSSRPDLPNSFLEG